MPLALTRYRGVQSQNAGGGLLIGAGVAAVVLVAMMLLPAMRSPVFVSRVTVTNPTEYGIEVDVSGAAGNEWMALGGFAPASTRTIYEVLDEGQRWVFRFSYSGQEMDRVAMTRKSLADGQWLVSIPRKLGDQLWAAGAPVSSRG